MGGSHGTRGGVSRRDTGASLVEFALLLPIFAMLLFGMISAGLALNDKQQMTHATREGARYAATVAADQTFTNGGEWAANVRDLIIERSAGVFDVPGDICVSLVEGSADAGGVTVVSEPGFPVTDFSTRSPVAPCVPDQDFPVSADDPGRRVQVTSTKPATIELVLFGSYSVTMDADATALSEPGA